MTIREQIREVVDRYTDDSCLYKDKECESRGVNGWCVSTDASYLCLMKRLGELGVVLKVEKAEVEGCSIVPQTNALCPYKEVGYAAVEPLEG